MKSAKQFDCITVGDVFVDIVMSGFASLPQLGEEAFASDLRREVGGGAAITACGLVRLGARVGLLAMVGQSDGQWLLDRLKDRGVETAGIRFHLTEPTGLTVAASTAEDRAFLTYNGANHFLKELLDDPRVHEPLARARHVHFALPIAPALLRAIAGKLHDAGCRVSVDVGWQKDWLEDERSIEALANIDLFLPNEREAELITGRPEPEAMLQSLSAMGVSRVALKRGARGAMLLWDDEIIECPPHRVRPVDATGAGDCFGAGFIYGLLQGESPERCLQIANLCGALSTESLGGIASFPDRDKVLNRLQNS
ncbi:MAG: carbohydrate kinase family protein [Blastocatellia bacterium]